MRSVRYRILWDWLGAGLLVMATPFALPHFGYGWEFLVVLLGIALCAVAFYNRPRGTFGNARFRGWFGGIINGLLGVEGIPLGRFLWLPFPMRYTGGRHLITIAPNGSGKGACVQIPTLLQYNASCVAIDPKGENAAVTAAYRRDKMGQKVFILNPFGVLAPQFAGLGFGSARFNPLARLDPQGAQFLSDVAAICEALVISESSEPYFDNAARDLFSCFVMHVCTEPGETPSLPRCRELLMQEKQAFHALLQYMATSKFQPLAQRVSTFIGESKTNDCIIQAARNHTAFLDNPALAQNLSASDFDFAAMKREKTTVYIVVPADKLNAYSRWFRLLITASLETMMSAPRGMKAPVLFLLDEFPILGNMSIIETAVGLARGFGIQLWFFLQDLSQLQQNYGTRAASFFANAGIQQFFTPNDMTTARTVSERLGTYTTRANNKSHVKNKDTGGRVMEPETRRELATPHELLGMPQNRQIVFLTGCEDGFLGIKKPYFKSGLARRAGRNPYI